MPIQIDTPEQFTQVCQGKTIASAWAESRDEGAAPRTVLTIQFTDGFELEVYPGLWDLQVSYRRAGEA